MPHLRSHLLQFLTGSQPDLKLEATADNLHACIAREGKFRIKNPLCQPTKETRVNTETTLHTFSFVPTGNTVAATWSLTVLVFVGAGGAPAVQCICV